MASLGCSVFAYYLIAFGLTTTTTAEICSEPWTFERNATDPVFIGFINGTFPERYTSLLWHWSSTKLKGEWETTLWASHTTDKLIGSMGFRDGDGKVPISLMWEYQNGNLTWMSRYSQLADISWSIRVCNMPIWSYNVNELGDWTFKLGDIELQEQDGEKIIYDKQEIMTTVSENVTEIFYNYSVGGTDSLQHI